MVKCFLLFYFEFLKFVDRVLSLQLSLVLILNFGPGGLKKVLRQRMLFGPTVRRQRGCKTPETVSHGVTKEYRFCFS